ncbi:MAG: hypothetical protein IAF94_19335 [Pirellulaceae bacterium]|nr:hypothetical protein [Pirellulaceae bacterium]
MSTSNASVLVKGELSVWHAIGFAVGVLAVVVGAVLLVLQLQAGWFVGAAGVVLALSVGSAALALWMRRTWVEDLGNGLVVRDRQGVRQHPDEQINGLALETKKQHNQGEIKGVSRIFKVWLDSTQSPVVMTNSIRTGYPDPLANLIDRLVGTLAGRMSDDIDRGGNATGDGWRLDKGHLLLGPSQEQAVPLAELVAVEIFEQKMCVWRRGQDAAIFKAPLGSRNAHLLPLLLEPRMPSADERREAPSTTGLGRILFERKPATVGISICAIFSIVAVVVGFILLAINWPKVEGILFLGLALAVSVLFALGAVVQRYMVFRCHQRGVFKASLFGEKLLPYANVASFTYSATKHYHNGAYVGTQLVMKFEPLTGSGAPAISYGASVQVADDDLEELRDFISRQLADRMAEQLSTGQPVTWTANLVFLREGIQYRPAGMLGIGRKEPQFLPYDAYGGCNLNEGVFYLFVQGNSKAVMTEQCNAANFFPGYYLLVMMTAGGE